MSKVIVSKAQDLWRRNLKQLWENAEQMVPDALATDRAAFRSATQHLLIGLGLVKSKRTGKLVFEGEVENVSDGSAS